MVSSHEQALQKTIDRFWETIPPVWNTVRSQLRSTATQEFHITVEQFHVLRHIRRGADSVSKLAEIRQISRPAVSQAVDALVRRGYISRTQLAGDRRRIHLALTPSGAALLDAIFDQARDWMKTRIATLPPDKLETIMSGLGLLREVLCAE